MVIHVGSGEGGKKKALRRFVEDIKSLKPNWTWEDNSTFIVE